MRWVFRLLVYFVKPLAIWYILAYFGYQTIRSLAYAITGYERSVKREEIRARASGESNGTSKGPRSTSRKSNRDKPADTTKPEEGL